MMDPSDRSNTVHSQGRGVDVKGLYRGSLLTWGQWDMGRGGDREVVIDYPHRGKKSQPPEEKTGEKGSRMVRARESARY